MEITRHGFDPGVGNSDQGLAQILIGEADGLKHGASGSAIASFGNSTTAMFQIHRRKGIKTKDAASRVC
jgi:hypothetical protein